MRSHERRVEFDRTTELLDRFGVVPPFLISDAEPVVAGGRIGVLIEQGPELLDGSLSLFCTQEQDPQLEMGPLKRRLDADRLSEFGDRLFDLPCIAQCQTEVEASFGRARA